MDIFLLGLVVVIVITVFALFTRKEPSSDGMLQDSASDPENGDAPIDYNEAFYRNLNGRNSVDIVKTYNPMDVAIIQSVLMENGIHSLAGNQYMSSLYPGVAVSGYTDVRISIAEDDVPAAKPILRDVISSLKSGPEQTAGNTVRRVLELAASGYTVPDSASRVLPELLV